MDANIKFRVECLPWDEAWTLFQEKVGNETLNSHPNVPELAKIVARECGCLPLPLITIGRAMSSKKTVREWSHAITILQNSVSDFPGMSEEVLPILKRSYDSLHNDTFKSCFLYCALYPEHHSIDKAKLIDYWIGEGLISLSEFNNLDEARNYGYDVIGDLKGACLLESDGQHKEETEVKLNAMIRNLALWITHECGNKRDKMFIIETSDLTAERSSSWYNNAERIYLIPPPDDVETKVRPQPPLKSPNLITLIHHFHYRIEYRDLSVVPQIFFEFTPLLRVLDLSRSNMETFPISITELAELRYLKLSWTHIQALPEELGKLVKLNFLDLSCMYYLTRIPSGVIGSLLLELRVLNLYECYQVVDWDIEEVDQLKHLNDLRITIYKEHTTLTKVLSNQNLQMCTRHLNIEGIPEANMGIEQQQHHLGSSCFQNLYQIQIFYCNGLKDLTWVGYVSNLKILRVYDCKELEEIVVRVVVDDLGGSTGGGNKIIFKSLKTLTLSGLPKLKSICRNALAFLCLESMVVVGCPQLKKLPFDSGSNVNNTLQRIEGGPKWYKLQWEEENHNNNNNNNELLTKSKFLPYFVERSYGD